MVTYPDENHRFSCNISYNTYIKDDSGIEELKTIRELRNCGIGS